MKKSVKIFAMAAIVSLSATGCMSSKLVKQGEPVGKIRINNYSDYSIGTVGIDSCSSFFAGQGGNRLPKGVKIEAKSFYEFDVNAGCWDLLMYTYSSTISNGATGSGSTGTVNGKVNVNAG